MKMINNNRLGYIFFVSGVCMYAFSDAIMQYFMPKYGVNQVIFLRAISRIVPLLIFVFYKQINPLITSKIKENIMRAMLASMSTYCFMYAYKYTSLTDVTVIGYSSAIMILPLSMLILKEKFYIYNAIAVTFGFLGILLAFRPGCGVFQTGSLFSILGAIISALNYIIIKKLSSTEGELTLIFYHHIVIIFFSFIIGLKTFVPLAKFDFIALFIGGLIGATAQYCIMHSFKLSTSSGLSSAGYLMLIPTTLIDYFIYNKIPDTYIIGGSIMILLGCSIAYAKLLKK